MVALWILAVIAWSLLPYRELSVALFGGAGFNLGDAVLLGVSAGFLAEGGASRQRGPVLTGLLLLGALTLLSAMKGGAAGEPLREIGRVLRGVSFWVILPLMIARLRTAAELRGWLAGMAVLLGFAAISLLAFSMDPGLIPAGEETGAFREETYAGFERVFTLGMWAVFAGTLVTAGRLLLGGGLRGPAAALLLILLAGLAVTFARTLFAGVLLGMLILLFFLHRRTALVVVGLAAAGTVFLAEGLLPDLAGAAVARLAEPITAAPEYAWQTFLWRASEVETAFSSFTSLPDLLFGAMGRVYSLEDGYTASVPHIGFAGLLYTHGIAGALAYSGLLATLTVRLGRTAVRSRGTSWHWLTAGCLAAWAGLLLTGVAAPLFHFAWGTAALACVAGASECVRRLLTPHTHAAPHDIHHHPLAQLAPPSAGDGGERPHTGSSPR
jgi:hypothetical protein